MKYIALLGLTMLALAQESVNYQVPIYKIADTPSLSVYKMVNQGCELYVALGFGGGYAATTVAITTARGCK